MSSLVIYGDTSGAITLTANAVAGTNTLTIPASTGTLLTKNASGYATNSTQPTFCAISSGSNQSIASGATANITYGTVVFDQSNSYNASTYTFTAPVTGRYCFNARARYDGITSGGNYGILAIYTTQRTAFSIHGPGSNSYYQEMVCSCLMPMNAGDIAYVYASSSGQTLTVVNTQTNYNDFSGWLVA